jgi:hypothetical protein
VARLEGERGRSGEGRRSSSIVGTGFELTIAPGPITLIVPDRVRPRVPGAEALAGGANVEAATGGCEVGTEEVEAPRVSNEKEGKSDMLKEPKLPKKESYVDGGLDLGAAGAGAGVCVVGGCWRSCCTSADAEATSDTLPGFGDKGSFCSSRLPSAWA